MAIKQMFGVLSYTCIQDNFIPLLVYPNDKKPAAYSTINMIFYGLSIHHKVQIPVSTPTNSRSTTMIIFLVIVLLISL